jgi:hypothetical protein
MHWHLWTGKVTAKYLEKYSAQCGGRRRRQMLIENQGKRI